MVMATKFQHQAHENFGIKLETGTEVNEPVYCEKLLGGYISNDFKWNEHVRGNEFSMFKTLTGDFGSKLCYFSPTRTSMIYSNGKT